MSNREIRENIYKEISKLVKLGIPFELACFACIIYHVNQSQKNYSVLYPFFGILFCDYYTLLSYKGYENTITKEDKQDYLKIAHFENLQDVIIYYQNDISLLKRALMACYRFEEMNVFGKMNYVQGLSKRDHEYLNQICPWHQQDQTAYGNWVKTDLYCKFMTLQKRANVNWNQIKEDIVIPQLIGFLKNLAKHNYPNYCSNAGEIMATDYIWSKYLIDKKPNLDALDMKNRLWRVQAYEASDIQDLLNEFICNDDYMYSVMESYCSIQTKEYPFEKSEMKEQVESYIEEVKSTQHCAKIKEFLD